MNSNVILSVGCSTYSKTKKRKGPISFYNKKSPSRVAEPEPAFLAEAGAEKITKFLLRLRFWLRLLVNCKAENYEFVTTKKNYFLPSYKITNFTCSTLGTSCF